MPGWLVTLLGAAIKIFAASAGEAAAKEIAASVSCKAAKGCPAKLAEIAALARQKQDEAAKTVQGDKAP